MAAPGGYHTRHDDLHYFANGVVIDGDIVLPDSPLQIEATPTDESVTTAKLDDGAVTAAKLDAPLLAGIPAAVADPGDAGAIPVTRSGAVALVTTEAGGETRTLAAPSFAGQTLTLCLDTDGGDCVVTVDTDVNVAGNNTLTLDNAGESIGLVGASVGSALVWRVAFNDGVGLTTVP